MKIKGELSKDFNYEYNCVINDIKSIKLTNWLEYILYNRVKRSNEDENDKKNSKEENKDNKDKTNKDDNNKGDDCDQRVKIDAFGGNYTLCLFIRPFKDEPIVKNSYDILNVSIFNTLNVSTDVSIKTFDLYSAMGHVIEGN